MLHHLSLGISDMERAAAFYDAALAGFSTDDKIHMIHYLDKMLGNFKSIDRDDGRDEAGPA